MSFKLPHHVKGTSTTTGTGIKTVVTASGFFGLSSQLSNGDLTWASFRQGSSDFEDGIYEFTSPDKLTLVTIYRNTNGGTPINWLAGTRDVVVGMMALPFETIFDPAAPNGIPYRTASQVFGTLVLGADSASLIAAASFAAMKALLDLEIGVDVQAWDADLDTIAGLAKTAGHVMRADGAAWLSVLLNAALVPYTTPVAPLTATDVEAALDQSGGFFAAGFSKSFTSSAQTITSAGPLTLPHGLIVKPKMVLVRLTCVTGEGGYTAGDTVEIPNGYAYLDHGQGIRTDQTNIYVRFGSSAQVYVVQHDDTGNEEALTNANWTVQFIAFA